MKTVKEVSEDEMIACFLKAEIISPRYKNILLSILKHFNETTEVLKKPNINDENENDIRYKILTEFRGYGKRTHLFDGFPYDVKWYEVWLTKKEVNKIRYANYSYWIKLSDNTRNPKIAAKNLQKGKKVFGESNENYFNAVEALKEGKKFNKIILVAKDKNSGLITLEGHLRLTAYFLEDKLLSNRLKTIIGFSKNMNKWGLY